MNKLLVPAVTEEVLQQDVNFCLDNRVRPILYISGPMRGSPEDAGPWENCRRGMLAAQLAWRAGWLPFCPMLNAVWEMVAGVLEPGANDGASGWLKYDFAIVGNSAAICRLPGYSSGGDREVAVAHEIGVAVFVPDCDERGYVTRMPSPVEILGPGYGEGF